MSFELDQLTEPEERKSPWQLPGSTDISEAKTIDDALEMSGLNWPVIQEPVFQKLPGDRKYRPVPNLVFNIRETDRAVLGTVSPKYNPNQNRRAFEFMEELVSGRKALRTDGHIGPLLEKGPLLFDRAGELENGKLVYITMRLPQDVKVDAKVGQVDPYLLVMNGHDGYRPLSASIQTIVYFCTNQLSASIDRAFSSWKLKHTANLANRLEVARETLSISFDYLQHFGEMVDVLTRAELDKDGALKLARLVFPVPEDATETQFERSQLFGVMQVWEYSETIPDDVRNTRWGLLNAMTEFLDHGTRYRSMSMPVEESRAESILFGNVAWRKQKAFDVLTGMRRAA